MLIHEMESLLRTVDTRLLRVEQILPTLATKSDVQDLRSDVTLLKSDVQGLKDDMRAFRADVDTSHRRLMVLYEDLKGDIRLLAEHLADQMHRMSDMSDVLRRLDRAR